ncbi:MAG: PRC-barrel domain-containing protein [Rhodospirillaceae bacterium]|nr:PRC-barrel domain-containing protein [Rhodospirillaceae bacterium]
MRKQLMLGVAALALALGPTSYGASAQSKTDPGADRPAKTLPAPNKADDRAAAEMQKRMQRLETAQPIDKAAISADDLIGTEVRNTRDQKLGSIKDIVVQDGKISSVVIARGGVLGMGTTYHQIDIAQAKVTTDKETVVLDLAEAQVKALPKVEWKEHAWQPTGTADDRKGASPPNVAPAAPPSTDKKMPPKSDRPINKD